MAVDPTNLTPKAGAGLPTYGSPVPPLLRPQPFNCLGGTVPAIPAYTRSVAEISRIGEFTIQGAGAVGSVVFLGDSIFEQMDATLITPFALNFGLSGNRTDALLDRMTTMQIPLQRARAVGLMINVNDINQSVANSVIQDYSMRILNWLTGPLVWVKTLPTQTLAQCNNIDINNAYIAGQLSGRPNCAIVDLKTQLVNGGSVLSAGYALDNIHLNEAGATILRNGIKAALATV